MGINLDHYFKLPEDWSPDEFWCVTLRIPAGDDYVDDLNAALNELRFSRNFGRDPTREGAATVSRTWAKALDWYNPIINREDCAVMGEGVVLRINPDTCTIEYQSCDNPDVWRPLAIDSGSTSTYDVREDTRQTVGWPSVPEGQDGACLAAANATAYFKAATGTMVAELEGSGIEAAILNIAWSFLLTLVEVPYFLFFQLAATTVLPALTSPTLPDEYAAFDWDHLECELFLHYSSDGSMTSANCADLLTAWSAEFSDSTVYKLIWLLGSFVLTTYGAGGMAKWAGIADADCSACDVSAVVTYDDGGYAYELPYGTIDGSGNPGNCALAESVNLPGPGWYTIARTKIFPPVGALNALSCDAKGFTADGFTIAIAGSLYYADDTIKASFSVEPGTMGDWTHVDLAIAWGQTVADDEYLIVDIAVATGGADVAVFGTTLRIDNITMET